MADLTLYEKLQPSLLDRLTDREPGVQRESRDRRVITEDLLRRSVLRDLEWLLNTGHLEALEDLTHLDEVAASVLNYGAPDVSGSLIGEEALEALESQIRDAILRFEPRILASSLKVTATHQRGLYSTKAVEFKIDGDLWAQPMPIGLYLSAELDLDTGIYSLLSHGS